LAAAGSREIEKRCSTASSRESLNRDEAIEVLGQLVEALRRLRDRERRGNR
jgi:hypothetical protein